MSEYFTVKRDYSTILTFHNHTYDDTVTSNEWQVYGGIENIGFDNDLGVHSESMKLSTTCMSILGPSSYLENGTNMYSSTDRFNLSMWIRLSTDAITRFYANINAFITIAEWTDSSDTKVSIRIAAHSGDATNKDMVFAILYGSAIYYASYPTYIEPGEWTHFMYCRAESTDRIFIDGILILTIAVDDSFMNDSTFDNFKVGNPYSQLDSGGFFQYDIDEVSLCNDSITIDEFTPPDRYLWWVYPEIEYTETGDEDSTTVHYKQGASTGLSYLYFHPTSITSSGVLTFPSDFTASNLMKMFLCINNTYMDPARYSISGNTVYLNNSIDISICNQSLFTFVCLKQLVLGEFSIAIHQITGANKQREYIIPYEKHLNTTDSFILFDGSLAAIQKNRYTFKKVSDTQYKIILNNRADYIGTNSTPLTFLYCRRNSYNTSVAEDDPNVNRQISFTKIQCLMVSKTKAVLPTESYGSIGYNINNVLVFLNGTYLPPDAFTISKNIIYVDENYCYHYSDRYFDDISNSNITLLLIQSSETQDYDSNKYITGFSEFDWILDHLRITRMNPYTKENHYMEDMYNKVKFYSGNKVPSSNFNYIDKFNIKFKY